MATVTGLTAERMIEMENATIISGEVVGDDLILTTRDDTDINAGNVRGPIGPGGSGFVICTSSTRPALDVGDEGVAIYETDTNLIRMWSGTTWKLQERIICTSITRPTMTSGDEGVKIYETDTNLEFIWTGTAWYLDTGPPPGSCYPWIGVSAPVNHVLMYGQTVVNADTLYPILWANLGGSTWKSGSSLIVPDLRGRIPVGKDNMGGSAINRVTNAGSGLTGTTLGAVGGSQFTQEHAHGTGLAVFGAGLLDFASGDEGVISTTTEYGDGSSQNIQPSIILNWILKIL
jgi:hypothetical protein